MIDSLDNYKQIDDIIDARKKMGQYDVYKQPHLINYRYAYSNSTSTQEKFIRFDDIMTLANDGDYLNKYELKPSDSEITVVKIHCESQRSKPNKWDMNDIAVPGDGSHLGESPSLVNLATLVQHNEYLVPLSSWDPYYKSDTDINLSKKFQEHAQSTNSLRIQEIDDEDEVDDNNDEENLNDDDDDDNSVSVISVISEDNTLETDTKIRISRRPSLAERFSKFLRKHCKKSKTLPEGCQPKSENKRYSKN